MSKIFAARFARRQLPRYPNISGYATGEAKTCKRPAGRPRSGIHIRIVVQQDFPTLTIVTVEVVATVRE